MGRGLGIGLMLTIAVGSVQPIGVSTQYVVLDAVLLDRFFPDVAADSAYFAEVAGQWTLATYEFFFVLGMPLGAFLAAWATNRLDQIGAVQVGPSLRTSLRPALSLIGAGLGGFLLLFGARFGGGCTSGHMISGLSQLAVSSVIFSAPYLSVPW